MWYAAQERKKGRTIEEVRDWAEANKLSLCHQFTVDDLHFLKRGGRISATTAVVGSMLQIKPVLHVDDEGHLINIGKARGHSSPATTGKIYTHLLDQNHTATLDRVANALK